MSNTIRNITEIIAQNLGIEPNTIIESIPAHLIDEIISEDQYEKIQALLNSDKEINDFGIDNDLGPNFEELKSNCALLIQVVTSSKSE